MQTEGQQTDAEEVFRAALAEWERVLGPEHPDVFGNCYNLTLVLEAQGRWKEAFDFARRAHDA